MMRKPIEASPIFIKPRPRLFHQVPVVETLKFIEMFSDNDAFYPSIKYFVKEMTDGAQRFFVDEIYDLSRLKKSLDFGRYKITKRGRVILETRLHLTYEDGVKYNIAANIIREFKIQPIRDLEPKIIESQTTASAAKSLSRTIGEDIGIKF
jgi:hypothetical protein